MARSGGTPWRVGWLVLSPSCGYDTCGLSRAITGSLGQGTVEDWWSNVVAEVNRSIHLSFYLFTQHSYRALFRAGH